MNCPRDCEASLEASGSIPYVQAGIIRRNHTMKGRIHTI